MTSWLRAIANSKYKTNILGYSPFPILFGVPISVH